MIFIYVLFDPRNGFVRYVGKCSNITKRICSHKNEKRQTRKCRWIESLSKIGLEPSIKIIECTDKDNWKAAERKWISYFRWAGCDLCNHTDGGEGVDGLDQEARDRLSLFQKTRWEKNRESIMKIMNSPSRCQKISKALLGRPKTPEHIAKLPQNHSKPKPPKIRHPRKKRINSAESNEKRSNTQSGRLKSIEWKEKIREGSLKRWTKEEERVMQSNRTKEQWIRRKENALRQIS